MASFDSTLDMAKTQVALRALRYGHFPEDIFDEYGWDMMLHMYIAALRKQTIYVDNVINLTSKNRPTGLRWIRYLEKSGMAESDGETIMLSADTFDKMDEYHKLGLELLE